VTDVGWRSIRYRASKLVHWQEITERELQQAIVQSSQPNQVRISQVCAANRSGGTPYVLAELLPGNTPVNCIRCILNGCKNWCSI
jgi:hypothetical protein